MVVASYFFGTLSIVIAVYFVFVVKNLIQKKSINIDKNYECTNMQKFVKVCIVQSLLYSLVFLLFGILIIVCQYPVLIFSIALFVGAISWVINKYQKKYLHKIDN